MPFEVSYVVTPLIGGLIGYITNDIAIRMLFRPHSAKHICGIRVPFTPGLIPKEKSRLADAIGKAVSENFMTESVLEKYLLSHDMMKKIRTGVDNYLNAQKTNPETVREYLNHILSQDEIYAITSGVKNSLTNQVNSALLNPKIGNKVAHIAVDHIADKFSLNGSRELLADAGGLGGLLSLGGQLGGGIMGSFLEALRDPTEKFLARQINTMLQNNGEQFVGNMLSEELNSILDKKMCELLNGHDEQLKKMADALENLYHTTIKNHLPKILKSVDVSKIVRDRVNEMDVLETEKLIFKVIHKELKAIVWLGALLGLIIGTVNLFF